MREDLLQAGLSLLATTNARHGEQWFMGHDGAVLLAGYFLLNEAGLREPIQRLIEADLDDRITSGGVSDQQLMPADSGTADLEPFLSALKTCCSVLSTTGHGVIFGALALKALQQQPALATPEIVDGLVQLLASCGQEQRPDRYFGTLDYPSSLPSTQEVESLGSLAQRAIMESEIAYADGIYEDKFYFFAGNSLHSITWAQALLDIRDCGYPDIASASIEPLQQHIILCRAKPADLPAFASSASFDPRIEQFWQRDGMEWHQIKLAYAWLKLEAITPFIDRERCLAVLSQYWAMQP